MRKKWIKWLIVSAVFGLLFLLTILILKDSIARFAFQEAAGKFSLRGLLLNAGSVKAEGISKIRIENLTLVPTGGDTLLVVDSIFAELRLSWLARGKIRLVRLYLDGTKLSLYRNSKKDNLSIFLSPGSKEIEGRSASKVPVSLSLVADRIIDNLFSITPKEIRLRSTVVQFELGSDSGYIQIPAIVMSDKKIKTDFKITDNNEISSWRIAGLIDPKEELISLSLFPTDSLPQGIPFLKHKTGADVRFDSLYLDFNAGTIKNEILPLEGSIRFCDLRLQDVRLADKMVVINHFQVNFSGELGSRYFKIDSISSLSINKINFRINVFAESSHHHLAEIEIKSNEISAADFFGSLPEGLFDRTRCIEADGNLTYRLHFKADSEFLDSLQFESSFEKENFRIRKYCSVYLPLLNENFEFKTQDPPYRSFIVGNENPDFTPLDKISPFLKNVILTAEDASFYHHKGFSEDAIRKAIITNIRRGGFVRGGSTITMQLIKNVFLTRKKNMSRKFEETLLVWLLETGRIVSKDRMLEVYLNVIEFGPGVYGIGEASRFYFEKKPSDLTLAESIFLSSIVPKPKKFKYSFDSNGNLLPYLDGYFNLISSIMARRNLIEEGNYDSLSRLVQLKGLALSHLSSSIPDSMNIDSNEEEMQEILFQERIK